MIWQLEEILAEIDAAVAESRLDESAVRCPQCHRNDAHGHNFALDGLRNKIAHRLMQAEQKRIG